ncbi:MAG: ImmA/IrrE family metallo-endopeptidase [Acidimicrobiales bacterium]
MDPFRIASGLGIRCRYADLPSDESGKITIPVGGTPVITINEWDHSNRQRFTCAHEIGHYLRRGHDGRTHYVDYRSTLAGLGIDAEEIFANQFAAALLMPAATVKKLSEEGRSSIWHPDLASQFGTSDRAMDLRLRNLRIT